jgi:hypothetical protein
MVSVSIVPRATARARPGIGLSPLNRHLKDMGIAAMRQLASREEAIKLGRTLIERSTIHHVTDKHTFKDDYLFYQFLADERV